MNKISIIGLILVLSACSNKSAENSRSAEAYSSAIEAGMAAELNAAHSPTDPRQITDTKGKSFGGPNDPALNHK